MAIFGEAFVPNETELILLREGNDWDVFLNYFFAVFFIFCFIIGILLNPFIIAYHAQQKRTFAKVLFLLVSSMDLFKSLYFPLVLAPKLLSPLGEGDYYYTDNMTTVLWTAYLNNFIFEIVWFEMDVAVILGLARYFSITRPMSQSRIRNIGFSVVLLFSLPKFFAGPIYAMFFVKDRVYFRIFDSIVTESFIGPLSYYFAFWMLLFIVAGGISTILTTLHLMKCDTASSEVSHQNVRRGILSLIAMSLFNLLLLVLMVCYEIHVHLTTWDTPTTASDFLLFGVAFGIPLSQSLFNSLSFLLISTPFRDFVKRCSL